MIATIPLLGTATQVVGDHVIATNPLLVATTVAAVVGTNDAAADPIGTSRDGHALEVATGIAGGGARKLGTL